MTSIPQLSQLLHICVCAFQTKSTWTPSRLKISMGNDFKKALFFSVCNKTRFVPQPFFLLHKIIHVGPWKYLWTISAKGNMMLIWIVETATIAHQINTIPIFFPSRKTLSSHLWLVIKFSFLSLINW